MAELLLVFIYPEPVSGTECWPWIKSLLKTVFHFHSWIPAKGTSACPSCHNPGALCMAAERQASDTLLTVGPASSSLGPATSSLLLRKDLRLPLPSSHHCTSSFSMNNRLPLGRPPLTSFTNNVSETTLANQNRAPSWVVICRVIEK